MAIKTASAKAKGRELQKYIAKRIEEYRDLDEGDVVSRPMGSAGVDILMSPRARERFPFSVECKSTAKQPTTKDLDQSTKNAYPETTPIVVWKPRGKNPKDALVIMRFEDLLDFVGENVGY